MDEKLVELFRKWLKAFESVQAATKEKDVVAAHKALSEVEVADRRNACRGPARACGEAWAASVPQ